MLKHKDKTLGYRDQMCPSLKEKIC